MTSTGRNVGLLAACQAMLFTNNTTLVAINGLAGLALTPVKALATLPVTCWILGGAIATMPASLHMKRVGRQRGLTQGVYWGVDRKSTRLNSSHTVISYAVFCLKKKKKNQNK